MHARVVDGCYVTPGIFRCEWEILAKERKTKANRSKMSGVMNVMDIICIFQGLGDNGYK